MNHGGLSDSISENGLVVWYVPRVGELLTRNKKADKEQIIHSTLPFEEAE